MKKVLLIYHRVDYDGVFSAVICTKFFQSLGDYEVIPYGYNYGDELYPNTVSDNLESIDSLCMVDVTYPPKDMIDLMYLFKDRPDKFIWIDHHETAINDSICFGYNSLPGLRIKEGLAACELTWNYFYPNTSVPLIVKYCSTYDIWDKNRFNWEEVNCVYYSLKSRYGVSYSNIFKNFDNLISYPDLKELVKEGKIIKGYLERSWRSSCNIYSFDILIDGKYKGICVLGTEFSSSIFNSVYNKYDLFCVCNRKGPDRYSISMYGDPDKLNNLGFSAGEYMKRNYNGGGHKVAAGGTLNFDQFWRLIVNCVL